VGTDAVVFVGLPFFICTTSKSTDIPRVSEWFIGFVLSVDLH